MNAARLLELARHSGATIATAESCTGGLVAAAITDIPGSSDVFDRGFVTYSNSAKTELLGVPAKLIERHGAVSEEVALAMAEGALARSNATHAVSITGIAGPGGTREKPEGMVCFGLAKSGAGTETTTQFFGARGREQVRASSVHVALAMLMEALN